MSAEFKLEGLDELVKKVETLGRKGSSIENKALKEAAEPVQKTGSDLTPRSDLDKEHLADNIVISKVKKKEGIKYIEIGPTKDDNSRFFYGKFIEWGTSKMAARPFMQPAYERNKKKIINIIKETLREGLGL